MISEMIIKLVNFKLFIDIYLKCIYIYYLNYLLKYCKISYSLTIKYVQKIYIPTI